MHYKDKLPQEHPIELSHHFLNITNFNNCVILGKELNY